MKFSVVTVTYNSERTIKDTFESVLKQKYRPLEYIIVDGLSNDKTMDIVKSYAPIFEKQGIEFRYISEKDSGISNAFNKGIKMATGEVIGIINSDDLIYEDAVENVIKNVEDDIAVYYGDCVIFNDNQKGRFLVKPKKDLDMLKQQMCVYHPSTFVMKSAYDKYGVFQENLRYCMDRELLLRFYVAGLKFKYINLPLACYREGGVNQVNYRKNVEEGTRISIQYGMNPAQATLIKYKKYIKYSIWQFSQKFGLEKLIHKQH